jgi:Ca2+-transporting ATPase
MLLTAGLWSAAVNIYLFTSQLRAGRPLQEAMAMTFVALVLIQFFNAYCCRSDHMSILDRPFANRWLNLAVGWELVLLVVIAYVPFFQRAFGTFALTTSDWLLTVGLAFSIVPVLELVKAVTRRRKG